MHLQMYLYVPILIPLSPSCSFFSYTFSQPLKSLLALILRCSELSRDQSWCSNPRLLGRSGSFRCRLHPDGDFLLALVGAGKAASPSSVRCQS